MGKVAIALLMCFAALIAASVVSGFAVINGQHFPSSSLRFDAIVLASTGWTEPATLVAFLLGPLTVIGWRLHSMQSGPASPSSSRTDEIAVLAYTHGAVMLLSFLTVLGGALRVVVWIKAPAHDRLVETYTFLGQGLVASALGMLALYVGGRIAQDDLTPRT